MLSLSVFIADNRNLSSSNTVCLAVNFWAFTEGPFCVQDDWKG